ncbi:glycolate oxidase subunit GlcE [Dongia sp.]|uniref:glycolate oxidase subunit GlcE n=1 Tax=Dongia sp. TaxID=1977262 RepID=UPI0037502138
MELLSPASLEEAADCVRAAIADKAALEILGASSKRGFGRPVDAARQITTAAMSGIISYHPEELVLVARAGTHMAEIAAALEEKNQFLAFEPPDFGKLYPGDDAGSNRTGTLGGILATNLSGPRRFKAGAARDHFLGFTAVNGRGEIFKGGGPVVKNVTGYDLPKLMAGSFGTLALMDEVTVKVLPRPERTRTVLLYGLDAAAANAAMTKALTGPYDISAAAFLPQIQAQSSDCDYVGAQGSVTALRVEGSGPVVEHHCAALRRDFAKDVGGATEELHSANSITLWREIRDLHPFFDIDTILWRISVPPAHGAGVAASCAIDIPGSNFLLDWGGGLVWLSSPASGGAHAEQVRRAFQRCGGHATLVRAPEAERRKVQVFEAEGARALTEQVKRAFDPERVLNPGRMFEGI